MRRIWFDEDAQPYYELVCDGCATQLVCWDDSCYDWNLLRGVAEFSGWWIDPDQIDGTHRCPHCRPGGAEPGLVVRPVPVRP
ncbi:hypothetical protein [Actinocatenispora thailandica]|nr:hypothetical protein [Actinocatenispora thailandica]